MGTKKLIVKMLELGQELDKADKQIECSMIVNDMTLLIDNHVKQQLNIHGVSNSALIDYIENDAKIAMLIKELMHVDGRYLTKKEYGRVLIKYLVKELRERYC